jgi:hypothetical protein
MSHTQYRSEDTPVTFGEITVRQTFVSCSSFSALSVNGGRPATQRRLLSQALFALLVVLLMASALRLFAQSVTGTITGSVTDVSGAIIPGAAVTIKDATTGILHQSVSNSTGIFSFPVLQPGIYNIEVSAQGFSKVVRNGVELQINQTANVPILLAIGSDTQTVQVSGEQPLLETQTVSLGTVIGAQEVEDLPLDGRQFAQLLELVPGTVPVSVSQTGGYLQIGTGGTNPSIGGATNRSNLFFINGVFATNPTYSFYAISPSVDDIQEFQSQSHAMEAEFGQATGGTVSVSTKAGTNQYHGSVWEYIRNNALDATPYFSGPFWNDGTASLQSYKQNQFGAAVGGPFLKNKLFGFGYYEGYRYLLASANHTNLPTAAELGGDFSSLLGLPNGAGVIYDPTTYSATTGQDQPFAGNIIPAGRLNTPLVSTLKAFLPATLPTADGLLSSNGYNYTNTQSAATTQNTYGIRVDYDITQKDLLYGQYFFQNTVAVGPGGLASDPFDSVFSGKQVGANYLHTFSPTLTAQATFGWLYATSPGFAVQPNPTALFSTGGFAGGFTTNPGGVIMPFIPGIGISNYQGVNSGQGGDYDELHQYSGSVNKQSGKHALKFGAAYYRATLNTNYAADGEGFNQQATYNPCATGTGASCAAGGGNGLASYVLNLPNNASRQLGNSGAFLKENVLGLYAQDTWKFNQKLTINYGIRWDYSSPVTDAGNRLSGFNEYNGEWYVPKGDVDAPSTLPADVYVSANHIAPNDYKNFSPRFGIDYAIDQKTVVRAGIGIFFDNWAGQIQATQNARGAWPSGGSQSVNNLNVVGLASSVAATGQAPFPGPPVESPTPFPSGGDFLDPHWRNAYSTQFNVELERQISNSSTVSLIYAGSSTARSTIDAPVNQSLVLGPTQDLPFPQMSQFGELSSEAHLSYNSFQSKFEKRYHNGVALKGAFTWSKDIDVGCADFWEACDIQDGHNLRAERANSSLNVPLVVTVSAVYKLPFGKGSQYLNTGVPAALVGGWQANGILSDHSGTPYTPGLTFDNTNSGGGGQRPNEVADPNSGFTRSINEWFNTAAYVHPAAYTYGNVGRNSMRGPAFNNLDASFFRNFTIFRESSFQFRAEFFNIFNHTNFGNPDATVGDSSYGTIRSQSGNSRQIQFAGKITF